jgi:hypothetical protein
MKGWGKNKQVRKYSFIHKLNEEKLQPVKGCKAAPTVVKDKQDFQNAHTNRRIK